MSKLVKLGLGLSVAFASVGAFALDTAAVVTSITSASTDLETVAVAIIGVAAVMFSISKVRQLIKA